MTTLSSCTDDNDAPFTEELIDGQYEGFGEGRSGMIKIRITVENHHITDATVLAQSESSFAQEALNEMVNRILAAQTYEGVDAVTGATLTSNGVIGALTMAIDAAYGRKPSTTLWAAYALMPTLRL